MKLTILERRGYYCYLRPDFHKERWDYTCVETGGGKFGYKLGWGSADTAEIFDSKEQLKGRISFHRRLFKPHTLKIELVNSDQVETIEAKFEKRLAYYPFTFEYNDCVFTYRSYRGNYRILFNGNQQVASFDKKKISHFGRETFETLAENDLNPVLMFALSIFHDIWTDNSREALITLDLGSLLAPSPPDNKALKPKLTTYNNR